jgi:hypothetical protein
MSNQQQPGWFFPLIPNISQIQNSGGGLPQRQAINFTGQGVTATDDPVNGRTNVAITGGGIAPGQTPISLVNGLNDNVSVPGGTVTTVRFTGWTGPVTLGGLAFASPPIAGQEYTFIFAVSGYQVSVDNLSSTSGSSNRIFTGTNGTVLLPVGGEPTIKVTFDGTRSCFVLQNTGVQQQEHYNVCNFGADPTGTVASDEAFAACAALATSGQEIFLPQGLYKLENTWGPFNTGVTIRGVNAAQLPLESYILAGSVIQYYGLGDAVRVTTEIDTVFPGYNVLKNFCVQGMNADNRAPCRTLPTQAVGGAVTSAVSGGTGLIELGMTSAHRLITGQMVFIQGVNGTTEANVAAIATVVDSTHFTIPVAFVHAFSSSPSSTVTYAAGAGVAFVGTGESTIENVFTSGFALGIVLDAAEAVTIRGCTHNGPYDTVYGDPTRFCAAVWMSDSASAARGWVGGTGVTNANKIETGVWAGARVGIWMQGGNLTSVQSCQIEMSPVAPVVGGFYCSTEISAINTATLEVTTATPHEIGYGSQVGDILYVGLQNVGGTTEANGEWTVIVVDATHFTVTGTVGRNGAITGAPTWTNAFTSGGIVKVWSPSCCAMISGPTNAHLDSCYSEGFADAHYLFCDPYGSATNSRAILITNPSCSGGAPNASTIPHVPFMWIDTPSTPYFGDDYSVTSLKADTFEAFCGAVYGSNGILGPFSTFGIFTESEDSSMTPGTDPFLDFNRTDTTGIQSVFNSNIGGSNIVGGTTGVPQAHWDIPVQDESIPILRIRAANAPYLDFWVNSSQSIDFYRNVQTAGVDYGTGTVESHRQVQVGSSAGSAVIATSAPLPEDSVVFAEIWCEAYSDSLTAGKHASWKFHVTVENNSTTCAISDGPYLDYQYIGDTGNWTTPTLAISGQTIQVSAAGETGHASSWEVRFDLTRAQD